ncbi:DUF4238 domain-containing protein [Acinetobacter pullicarnis]|uniref:DUF4238 domain-containing protein n=1 Tax=Acinetobacter pullicarnis TaxID=2576829 RepID=UPI001122E782|nr:DUF4238 domain-containing protein [Acinetobacter pullicarnis]
MTKTRDNHYVPQWYQKGFIDEKDNQLCHLSRRKIDLQNGEFKIINSKKWQTSAQRFYEIDLYSTFFGTEINDDIEKKLFGPIDDNGSKAVKAFLTDDESLWHHNFLDLFTYIDAQKIRTPKGLDWIKSRYPELTQLELMLEMQALRTIHCTLWSEGIRELVSAEDSDVKFIISDHPITIYNYACSPNSKECQYPNDPDIALKGSQTIFPLDKNRCLILTNQEYAQDPINTNPLEPRTNAIRNRQSLVSTIDFINCRKLTRDEVSKINYIIKCRAKTSIAAGNKNWLHPEENLGCTWDELRTVLLPPPDKISTYSEMYAQFEDGTTHYQDSFGRSTKQNDYLNKLVDETKLGRNDLCGCGSGKKYKTCCLRTPIELRTTWNVASIRERNLAFCRCIRDILGIDNGKTWKDIRRELSNSQIIDIYKYYSILWPRETDIYSLLPKLDGKYRGLYTGILDVRTIHKNALPAAAMFEEFLIQIPIMNPNNLKPEFNPISSPNQYKYQALKDFLFMLELEPYIEYGYINLIPDPSEFDLELKKAMFEMAKSRSHLKVVNSKADREACLLLGAADLLNTTSSMPIETRIKMLINEFNLDEIEAKQFLQEFDSHIETSALTLLQPISSEKSGQFIQYCMGPNYEMALLIAQITGSVIVTDSESRWQELISAQHRNQGLIIYPWNRMLNELDIAPIDDQFLKKIIKSQAGISTFRDILKKVDHIILNNHQDTEKLTKIANQILNIKEEFQHTSSLVRTMDLKIVSPDGGFYDKNVQRLLARSSCMNYENKVRSIYGVNL